MDALVEAIVEEMQEGLLVLEGAQEPSLPPRCEVWLLGWFYVARLRSLLATAAYSEGQITDVTVFGDADHLVRVRPKAHYLYLVFRCIAEGSMTYTYLMPCGGGCFVDRCVVDSTGGREALFALEEGVEEYALMHEVVG